MIIFFFFSERNITTRFMVAQSKENAKLVAEKKTSKAGIEAEAMAKAEGKGKAKLKPKYKYTEHFMVRDQPLKETASRDGFASNQLAEAKVEREDTLKVEENIMLGAEKTDA